MANPHGSFIWYELMSPDPDASKLFYDSVVGWDIEPHPAGELDYRMIRRRDGGNAGGLLRLTNAMMADGARPMWLGYIGVDDVDRSVADATADGAAVHLPAHDLAGVGRMAMIADPSGASFYLMRGASEGTSDVFSVDQPQHVRWNELWSDNPAASIDFYTRHFGWVQEGDMDMGAMGKYQFLHHGGAMIGAVMTRMPDMPVSMWNFYVGVDDIDRAAKAVRDGGGQVFQEPIEIPGGEYSINAADPQGAMIGFVGPRKEARS